MNIFPVQHELIALFESGPVLTDADVPWKYNQLRFSRTIGDSTLECEIEPGYETLKFRWLLNGTEILNLDLERVSRITVEWGTEREALVVHLLKHRGVQPGRIQFTPVIHVSWGTTEHLN